MFLTVSIICLALSLGCTPDAVLEPEVKTAPQWSQNPSLTSEVKGEFSVIQGQADGTAPIQYVYYWKTSNTDAPLESSDATLWSNAGWTSIAQDQLSEPVHGIKEGGTITFYAIASNSEGFDIAGPFTVEVEKPVAPVRWGEVPTASVANGVFAITPGVAKGLTTDEPPQEVDLEPPGDYAYYYAKSAEPSPSPPGEGEDSPSDWVASQWNSIQPDEKLALDPGDYVAYAVVVNNGGSLRMQITPNAGEEFFTISPNKPVWTAQPVVQSGDGHGVFTLKSGGLAEGNPGAIEFQYYFADPLASQPNDIETPDAWAGELWTAVDVGQTLDFTDPKNIKPGAADYQLYGVAENSEGATLSDKIPVLIKGLSAWVNQAVTNSPPILTRSAAIVVNSELYVIAGHNGSTYTSDVWHSAYNADTKKWTWQENTNSPGFGTLGEHMLATDGSVIYVLGGRSGAGADSSNKVWKGTPPSDASNPADIAWSELTSTASWSPRIDASVAFFNGSLYLMGGQDMDGRKLNDVWKSDDGANWTRIKINAEWSARHKAALVPHNNKMWLLGGFSSSRLNDVWTSEDGATWTKVSEDSDWTSREGMRAVSYQEKIWVLGGKDSSGEVKDVWFSSDGLQWYKANADALDGLTQVGFAGALEDGIIAYGFTSTFMVVASWIDTENP